MTVLRKALNRIWASDPAAGIAALPDAKWRQGWVAEIPAFQHLNWLHNVLDTNQLALAERGIFEYGPDVSYAKGALAWREADGFIYVALVSNPTLPPPSIQWERSCVQLSREDFEKLVSDWNKHLTDFNNPHKVTALQAGAVPVTGGDYTGLVNHTTIKFGSTGESQFLEDADGSSWVYKGVKIFNISPTKIPRTFYSGAWWTFLYEENYVNLRRAKEGLFSVPVPDINIPMTSSLYPTDSADTVYPDYTRAGTLNYTDKNGQAAVAPANTPAFGRRGLVLKGRDTKLVGLKLPTDKNFTLSFVVNRTSGTSFTKLTPFESVGNFTIVIEGEWIKVFSSAMLQFQRPMPTTSSTNITIKVDNTLFALYVNGVEVQANGVWVMNTTGEAFIGAATDTATNAELTGFKFWYKSLSKEQISGI